MSLDPPLVRSSAILKIFLNTLFSYLLKCDTWNTSVSTNAFSWMLFMSSVVTLIPFLLQQKMAFYWIYKILIWFSTQDSSQPISHAIANIISRCKLRVSKQRYIFEINSFEELWYYFGIVHPNKQRVILFARRVLRRKTWHLRIGEQNIQEPTIFLGDTEP